MMCEIIWERASNLGISLKSVTNKLANMFLREKLKIFDAVFDGLIPLFIQF